MSKKEIDFTWADKVKIREDMQDHGNLARAAIEWGTTERVIRIIWRFRGL